ncbi:MAG: translation initiation factor IF-2 subunit beta [Candidatus Nanohalobium sp.]
MNNYDELLEKGKEETPDDLEKEERFEIPELKTRKDGSRTIVEDFSSVAEKLGRDEKVLSNFIQNELGTAGHIEGGELVLNGEFRRGNVQGRLENYVEKRVYCPECGSPDTKIKKEKEVEILKCQACGARTPL